ncbi:MAG: peptide chain release factor N(5)-glutamine methyltransferase [Planctomycetota bacterium]|jgi:release factor glutamine methyltransferase
METWTIQRLLNWITEHFAEHNVDSPRLSAELLLSHVLGVKRIDLYTQFDKIVSENHLDKLHELVKRCGEHEPLAYLIGRTEFYSLDIKVNPDCMIPRPETELLVERAIEFIRKREGKQFVCDLCTGSGCIAVAIAKNCSNANIVATDICDSALSVAAENVANHDADERVTLLCGDLFAPIIEGLDNTEFDLVVCNPPYVSSAEYEVLDKNVKDYEPKRALWAGVDGLDIYRRIAERVDEFLKPDAALMLEIGYAQGRAVRELLGQTGIFAEIKIEKDNQNNDRIVIAKKSTWDTSQKPDVSEEVT